MKAIRNITAHIYKEIAANGTVTNCITGEVKQLTRIEDTGETMRGMAYESKGRVMVEYMGEWYNVRYKGIHYIVV